jgi:preprotein translocase SecE subunit
LIAIIKKQVKDLWTELDRVDWPTKDKVLHATYAVVAVSLFVGFFLWGSDLLISWGMTFILPSH